MSPLVLSLFPGIGLLDMAFEEQGFCVVRGPDVIWGGDIERFHPPAERFEGVVGGPPCQEFSQLAHLVRSKGHKPRFGNLIPEFERCVSEAAPRWFVMENVRGAPLPVVASYDVWSMLLRDSDVGGVQPRVRRISMGIREGTRDVEWSPFCAIEYAETVATKGYIYAGHGPLPNQRQSVLGDARAVPVRWGGSGRLKRSVTGSPRVAPFDEQVKSAELGAGVLPGTGKRISVGDMLEAQGLPSDHLDAAPFTVEGQRRVIGNGVPLPMGRAIARAVVAVMYGGADLAADLEVTL